MQSLYHGMIQLLLQWTRQTFETIGLAREVA